MDVLSPLSLSSVILIDSTTESPVHVLMLSIQAVRGLPRLRAPGIVPCIIRAGFKRGQTGQLPRPPQLRGLHKNSKNYYPIKET